MAEIATNKIISKFFALLEINLPFFSHISDELAEINKDFLNKVGGKKVSSAYLYAKYNKSLDEIVNQVFNNLFPLQGRINSGDVFIYKDIIREAFFNITNNRYNSRFLNYFARHAFLNQFLNIFDPEQFFEGTLPILIGGYTPVSENSNKKVGIDPYSYRNYFTTKLLLDVDSFLQKNPDFLMPLQNVSLLYLQPNLYLQFFRNHDDLRLEDIASSLEILNMNFSDDFRPPSDFISLIETQFKNLKKFAYKNYGPTYSVFSLELFDVNQLKKNLKYDPLRYSQLIEQLGFENTIEMINYAKKVSNLAQRVLAFRTANIIERTFDYLSSKVNEFDLFGIPSYMKKTGYASKVLELARKEFLTAFDNQISFFYVGGDKGIFGNVKKLPREGICENSAIRKLIGFISSLDEVSKRNLKKPSIIQHKEDKAYPILYISSEKYPFLLIEKEFKNKHPNLEDLLEEVVPKSPLSLDELREFFARFKVGIRRIEPTIVNMIYDSLVNTGLLNVSNNKSSLKSLIQNKELILPNQITDFFDKIVADKTIARPESKSDFRLSLFSLPTSPKILKKYFVDDSAMDEIDGGCPINKCISQDLERLCDSLNSICSLNLNYRFLKEQLHSRIADTGTVVHSLISAPFPELVHYNTLNRIGLPSEDSSNYCELPFLIDYNLGEQIVKIGFHPDATLFLRDKQEPHNLDIIVLDTKTKSAHPYFEHKYLLQTYFYADFIAKLLEQKLEFRVNDYYLVINRLAFFGKHYAESKDEDLVYYRQQTLSPVIRITKDDKFHIIANKVLNSAISDFLALKRKPTRFLEFREISEKKHYCKSCFLNHQTICNEIYNSLMHFH